MNKETVSDFIGLCFAGKKLDPGKITECLGMEPKACACSGDSIKTPSGRVKKAKNGFCTFGSRSELDIDKQFTLFTRRFRKKAIELRKIMSWKSIEMAYIEVIVHPPLDYGVHGIVLKAKDVEFWGHVGIDIGCSFWNPSLVEELILEPGENNEASGNLYPRISENEINTRY